ncbi:MAG TPA: hypothetical protein VKB65_00355 [Myxococcota bacterium]|nr:hypothetical protein [Myxococcota bacterium]
MSAPRLRSLVLAAVLALGSGCGSFWSIADTDGTLEDSIRTYAKLVRWGEIERASLFVDEEVRDDFVALAPELARLHFTDFDLGPVDQQPDGEARLTVVYRFFDPSTMVERQVREAQVWTSPGTNVWIVRPDLSGFESALGTPRRKPSG